MINNYPYTDFHELNTDWLLNEVKTLKDKVDKLPEDYPDLDQITAQIDNLQNIVDLLVLNKVDKIPGMGLSENDFTNAEQTKLAGIEAGAEVNVQADWNVTNTNSDAYIKNKPTITPGSPKNIWYAECTTAAGTAAKVATSDTADFVLAAGNMVRVQFTNANSYNGTATLNVDGTGAHNITRVGTTTTTRYYWTAGEVVDLVYDGTNFVMSNKGTASTTYYGLTKLSSSVSSTSEALAATPKAVKTVNDALAGKVDAVAGKGLSSNDFTDVEKALVDNTAAYVADQGTSGTWMWRRWSDNRYECWSVIGVTDLAITSQSGNVYYASVSPISYPFTFNARPLLIMGVCGETSGCWVGSTFAGLSATGTIYVFKSVAATLNVTLNIYLTGYVTP